MSGHDTVLTCLTYLDADGRGGSAISVATDDVDFRSVHAEDDTVILLDASGTRYRIEDSEVLADAILSGAVSACVVQYRDSDTMVRIRESIIEVCSPDQAPGPGGAR